MKYPYKKYLYIPEPLKNLLKAKLTSSKQRRTFFLHLIYSILDGIILGVLALNEFVLIKGLDGSDYQTALLFQFTTVILLFSIVLNQVLKRTKRKKRFLKIVAVVTRLPLLLLLIFPDNISEVHNPFIYQALFLFIFLIYYSANPVIFPVINLLLKTNYKNKNFSKFYSWATAANKVVMLIVTFFTGIILDYSPSSYTKIYPLLAILGITSIFILMKIDYSGVNIVIPKKSLKEDISNSLKKMLAILKSNKPFRDFEIGFMLYGFAWLATIAVIAIFLDKALHLSYTGIAFYKNVYTGISIILTPIFGKLLGSIDPRKFAVYNFSALLLYLFFMGLTEYVSASITIGGITIYWTLLASYISYGFFAAMMALLWYIGSAYFCRDNEAADYQSIHLSITGFRALFAPLFGIFFLKLVGYTGVFLIGIGSLSIGIALMFWSMRHRKLIDIIKKTSD
ncbi:MAG: MFS transporter [Bacteroidota bacterium]|nr:MFS transporter [Bacteroidota bacterium]